MKKFIVVSSVGIALAATSVGVAAADDHVAPVAAPAVAPAVAPVAASTPARIIKAIKDSDPALTYAQAGRVVTITKGATAVATVTLKSADYAAKSGQVVLSVAAARPFTVDPKMFTLYDAEGWENDARQTKPVRFETGAGSLSLTFTGTPARPEALGWVPQHGKEAVAVWERG